MSDRFRLFFLLMGFAASARAGQINWGSAFNGTNVLSGGGTMNGQMTFELGVFTAGFTPTAANTPQWAANWRRASLAFYNVDLRYFTGSHQVTSNAPPFAAGTKGYVWGHDGNCTGAEWILLSAPGWTWPSQNPVELPVNWTVSSASQVIVGQANGAGFLMKTGSVNAAPPTTSWAEWRAKIFSAGQLADNSVSAPLADPDRDGTANLAEFAMGGHPLIPGGTQGRVSAGWTIDGGRSRLTMTVTKRCDRLVQWSAQASTNLAAWDGPVAMVSETPEALTVREDFTLPVPRIFLRPVFLLP